MENKTFKVGDKVVIVTSLGVYSTVKEIVSIQSNLARCKWSHEGKTYHMEYLFEDLILARSQD